MPPFKNMEEFVTTLLAGDPLEALIWRIRAEGRVPLADAVGGDAAIAAAWADCARPRKKLELLVMAGIDCSAILATYCDAAERHGMSPTGMCGPNDTFVWLQLIDHHHAPPTLAELSAGLARPRRG